jgi:NitT/TauT family transport system substrate-binding protein
MAGQTTRRCVSAYMPITDAAGLLAAYAKGFFTDEGLKAEPPTLMRAWAPMVDAFSAGKFNPMHLLIPLPVWMRYNNHVPVKLVAWARENGSAVTVGLHSNIQNFGDFGGKRVAVPFWYSVPFQTHLACAFCKESGGYPVRKFLLANTP